MDKIRFNIIVQYHVLMNVSPAPAVWKKRSLGVESAFAVLRVLGRAGKFFIYIPFGLKGDMF